MQRLLYHIDVISRQRNRGQLEASLVSALREMLDAGRVALYKLFTPPGDMMVGLAAIADRNTTRILDDGISWPEGTGSIERFPILKSSLAQNGPVHEFDPEVGCSRQVLPILGANLRPFGLIAIDAPEKLDATQIAIVDGLTALFRNCVALLDYSEIDTLTGLLNRKTFDEYLINILSHVANDDSNGISPHSPRRRHMRQIVNHHWLGVMDIDHFKNINDSFGHLIGDEVLILVANLMKSCFRTQDKLFRFGGEEFVVLLKPTELSHATATFERYRQEIESFNFPQVGKVTISIGFTRIGLYDTPSMIMDDADVALYYAKEHGRNQVCCYEDLINSGKLARHETMRSDVELF